jgi:uncharacterized protein (UPF0276 family)
MLADMPTSLSLPPLVGVGLKPQHYAAALERMSASIPPDARLPGWFEVHPQNYFGNGGPPHRWLSAFAEKVPLSFHSVGLSLGSHDGANLQELERLAGLCERYAPAMVSDHLSWSGDAGNRYPDLLPLPYTKEALDHVSFQIDRVQERLARTILVENPSRYLAFVGDEMCEAEFLHALCERTGCGLLLDINNIEVSATNLGLDANVMLDAIDPSLVGEVHLAGHACEDHEYGLLLIDDHGSAVSTATWQLFERFLMRSGPIPVLIEWDTNLPEFDDLVDEASVADAIMKRIARLRQSLRGYPYAVA